MDGHNAVIGCCAESLCSEIKSLVVVAVKFGVSQGGTSE